LEAASVPRYLDETAASLLAEAREGYQTLGLGRRGVVPLDDGGALIATWRGTAATSSLGLALRGLGLTVTCDDVVIETRSHADDAPSVDTALQTLARRPPPDPVDLAEAISSLETEKFHRHLSRPLLLREAAAAAIDADAVPLMARELAAGAKQ
jgi:hypothetical protein